MAFGFGMGFQFGTRGGGGGPAVVYSDDFSTAGDLSSWTRGFNSVDGTLQVSGGTLIHTKGAGDGSFARWVRPIEGATIGKLYRAVAGSIGGTQPNAKFQVSVASNGGGNGAEKVATGTTIYAVVIFATPSATTGQTGIYDYLSVVELPAPLP